MVRDLSFLRSAVTIERAPCLRIGALLADGRQQRGLSCQNVAERLLMSKRQVNGLETADASGFYNASYFVAGLRKYASFIGLPLDVDNDMLMSPEPPAPAPPPGPRMLSAWDQPRVWPWLVMVVVGTMLAVGGAALGFGR
jgi:transcriptional regulator with XRE-family HTH domain